MQNVYNYPTLSYRPASLKDKISHLSFLPYRRDRPPFSTDIFNIGGRAGGAVDMVGIPVTGVRNYFRVPRRNHPSCFEKERFPPVLLGGYYYRQVEYMEVIPVDK